VTGRERCPRTGTDRLHCQRAYRPWKILRHAVTSEPRGVSIYADEERAHRKNECENVSGVKPSTWAPRCDPGLVSSPAWSGQGFFRASPCPARRYSSSRAPSSPTLTPQSETCEPWRQQALACHVFDGPHAAAPQHGACHTAFRSILAHIIIKLKPLAPLHQHYFFAGQRAMCVACRSGGLQTSSRVF
jgi:hypothetical protein